MLYQLLTGGLVSLVNFGIHALMTMWIVMATRRTATRTDHLHEFLRLTALLTITMLALMCAHVVEITAWAGLYALAGVPIGSIGVFEFAFENYTALGYGDAVAGGGLAPDRADHRAERTSSDRLVCRHHLRSHADGGNLRGQRG